ncbi:MAG: hydrogenase formation protein HypD [Desulfobacterales bacterium]|nr:hydrogenase formation protein HypD [Desulfobacterales bacterium]
MAIKHMEEYKDPRISRSLAEKIKRESRKSIRLMEVCGTHTMSIFRNGIREILPETIALLSGPGCPVCVTAQKEIDAFIDLAGREEVIVATFGDLIRVPGGETSLQKRRAAGGDVRVVYSAQDALEIAKKNPDKNVVFPGVGFETTAPTIAASILFAEREGIDNFTVFSAHKLVPPALAALMEAEDVNVDGFILPGHVSVIIGVRSYEPFFETHRIPCVIAGFEPVDMLQAISMLVEAIEDDAPRLENAYPRAVTREGNPRAMEIMNQVFEIADVAWRGVGPIPQSGLKIREAYARFDAERRFDIAPSEADDPKGCACGAILTGVITPPECPLYKKVCTPSEPVGPCMVSSEGTCAAYYRYHAENRRRV